MPARSAAMALRKFRQHLFGMVDLRQHPLRQRQQILPRLREAQAAPLFLPDADAVAGLELAHRVRQGGLREVQPLCREGERAKPVDFAQDGKMLAVDHG